MQCIPEYANKTRRVLRTSQNYTLFLLLQFRKNNNRVAHMFASSETAYCIVKVYAQGGPKITEVHLH